MDFALRDKRLAPTYRGRPATSAGQTFRDTCARPDEFVVGRSSFSRISTNSTSGIPISTRRATQENMSAPPPGEVVRRSPRRHRPVVQDELFPCSAHSRLIGILPLVPPSSIRPEVKELPPLPAEGAAGGPQIVLHFRRRERDRKSGSTGGGRARIGVPCGGRSGPPGTRPQASPPRTL